jgi:hypothetical protein
MSQKSKLVLGFQQGDFKSFCDLFLLCSATGDNKFINSFLKLSQTFCPFKSCLFSEDLFGTDSPGVTCLDSMFALYVTVLTKKLAFAFNTVFFFYFAATGRTLGFFLCNLLSLLSFKHSFHPEF